MNRRISSLVLFIILVASAVVMAGSTAANTEASGPRLAFQALQSRSVGALTVHWDPVSGTPDFLSAAPGAAIPYTPSAAEHGNPTAIARGFLDENRELFKLSAVSDDFSVSRVEPDMQLGYAHVRLAQVYRGLPVFGRQLVVHVNPHEEITAVNGHFQPELNVATTPALDRERATELALQDLRENQLEATERETVKTQVLGDKTQLLIYVDAGGHPTLTWYLTILTTSPLGQWHYFVNARRPVVVNAYDTIDHAKERKTYTANNGTDLPGRLMIEEGERSKDQIAQAAHDAAGKVYDYYFTHFKRDGIDGQGSPMVSTVHYGSDPSDAENAAWIGEVQQMIYGDGGRMFKPLAYGLDVVGHEFTHGITDSTAQLEYQSQSGALNESYSDVFGVLIAGTDWTVGRSVIKSPPYPVPFLRSLSDPEINGNYDARDPLNSLGQPGYVSDYAKLPNSRKADNGGVHINSGIPNHSAYFIAQAIGNDKIGQIYYRTLTQYLTPTSNFQDAAQATVRAAQDLFGATEVNAVRDGFARVGINVGGANTVPASPTTTPPQSKPAPAPAPSTQNVPAGCNNIIQDGGFEGTGVWTEVSTSHSAIIDTQLPHTGKQSAWLGGTDQEPLQYIYQDVLIPANATRVELDYYRYLHQETSGLLGFLATDAVFDVEFQNTNGDVLGTVEELKSSQANENWSAIKADVTRFAGKNVRLVIRANNPKRNISSLFVDDVQLIVCTTGTAPSAPQPSSQDAVFVQGTVKSSTTGRGVQGAQVFIIKPGLSATDAAADDTITRSEIITMGVSDANGVYQTQAAIPRGQKYSVVIIAGGYRPIVADDAINVPSNADNPFLVNATLRPSY